MTTGLAIEKTAAKSRVSTVRAALPFVTVFLGGLVLTLLPLLSSVQQGSLRGFVVSTDFRAYYTAGSMALGGVSADLYDLPTQYLWQHRLMPEVADPSHLLSFLNPPFVAIALVPFALLPLETAYVLWMVVNVALLAVTSWLLVAGLGAVPRRARLCTLAMAVTFFPVIIAVLQGQFSFVFVLALLLSWRAFRSGRDLSGGLWLALLLVKPQLVVVPLLVLAWKRRLWALGGFALGGAALLLASLALVGWEGLKGYVGVLLAATSWGDAYGIHPTVMHTWRGFLHLLLQTDNAGDVQVWWLAGVAVALALLLWSWRGSWETAAPRFDLRWALLVVTALFISPHAYWHDVSILLVPGVMIARYIGERQVKARSDAVLVVLLPLGYLMVWAAVLWSATARLQLTVILMFAALLFLAWKARQAGRCSLAESA